MAQVKTLNGTKLLVQIGDGGGTEVFAEDCLINAERGISFASDTNEVIVPDCAAPDDPAWKEITKDGLSASITGGGLLHTTSTEAWWDWFEGDIAKNCRVNIDTSVADGGGYWQGAFKLTAFELTGARNDKIQVSVTLASNGLIIWEDA